MPRKPRPKLADSVAQKAFLAAFRITPNVRAAAAAAKLEGPEVHYGWVRRNSVYRASWEAEVEDLAQSLEDEAVRRAKEGVKRALYYKGKPMKTGRGKNARIAYETEYSDQLLIALLKRFRPALYRERTTTEITGSVEIVNRLQAARARLIKMQANEQPDSAAG